VKQWGVGWKIFSVKDFLNKTKMVDWVLPWRNEIAIKLERKIQNIKTKNQARKNNYPSKDMYPLALFFRHRKRFHIFYFTSYSHPSKIT
jgi:hypothetical protein